jgi:hypothetical protein
MLDEKTPVRCTGRKSCVRPAALYPFSFSKSNLRGIDAWHARNFYAPFHTIRCRSRGVVALRVYYPTFRTPELDMILGSRASWQHRKRFRGCCGIPKSIHMEHRAAREQFAGPERRESLPERPLPDQHVMSGADAPVCWFGGL